jgi:alpha-mannosidase
MGVVEVGKDEAAGTGGPAYGSLVYDEPLSEIRPREVQNFMSASDARLGLTMSTSVAVNDFQDPTGDPAGSPLLQAVLLASRRSCHAEGNWYLQEGDHHYRFSVVSHPPGWRNGYRSAIQVNGPLFTILEPAREAGAALPESKSFFSVSAPNVLISTIKKCEDDEAVIVRGYDIEGKGSGAQLEFFFPVEKAERVNMIEDEGKTIPSGRTALLWNVGPNAIETFKLYPAKIKSD